MVAPEETFITGEGDDVAILVIPHHYLGGTSLVVTSTPVGIDVCWAAVTDLSYHDQIDLGHTVERWPAGSRLEEIQSRLVDEFARPIEWVVTFKGQGLTPRRARARLDLNGKLVGVDVLWQLGIWPFLGRSRTEQTSLGSIEPPAFQLPVPIDHLLSQT